MESPGYTYYHYNWEELRNAGHFRRQHVKCLAKFGLLKKKNICFSHRKAFLFQQNGKQI